jgi:hypothetical protein
MKIEEIKIIQSVLGRNVGRLWFLPLMKSLIARKRIFRNTRWGKTRGEESAFIERISLAPSLVKELDEMIGKDNAVATVQEVLIAVGCAEQRKHLSSMNVAESNAMGRLEAFNKLMDEKGAPKFNEREYVRQDDKVCHFVITRCVFSDFFAETGMPGLTRAFCEIDRLFFPDAFPELRFHRGDSWENTIAYEKDHCEFVFERQK